MSCKLIRFAVPVANAGAGTGTGSLTLGLRGFIEKVQIVCETGLTATIALSIGSENAAIGDETVLSLASCTGNANHLYPRQYSTKPSDGSLLSTLVPVNRFVFSQGDSLKVALSSGGTNTYAAVVYVTVQPMD